VLVVGVEQGIILAIVLSLLDHVRRHYRPHDSVITFDDRGRPHEVPSRPGAETEPGLVVYRFGVGLFYANVTRFSTEALALVDTPTRPQWFVLLADAIDDVDFTAGQALVELAKQMSRRSVVFAVAAARADVLTELDRFGLVDVIGRNRVFATLDAAVEAFRAR
jgi:MFS superfamily sulfate permease-like transporter